MDYLDSLIKERHLPQLENEKGQVIANARMLDEAKPYLRHLLEEEEYGMMPPKPDGIKAELVETDSEFLAGKATFSLYNLIIAMGNELCSFPVRAVIPNKVDGKNPAFVHINFRPHIPDIYQPTEEIIDHGYAIFSFCYKEVATDSNDFSYGCAKVLCRDRTKENATGKIAMWAWASMRVMDMIETIPQIDRERVAVIGHSRLGKAALLASAYDDRFRYVISNDSGCSGAALLRMKKGESVEQIADVFPFWFCPRFVRNAKEGKEIPIDQHFLLALSLPRHILVGGAEEDLWADPVSEFLCLYQAGKYDTFYGNSGLVTQDKIPIAKKVLSGGNLSYHIRHGKHYLSREDWQIYMDYMDKHR